MRNSYTIRDLLALLLSKIWIIIFVTLVAGIFSFGVAKFIMPLKFEAYTSMYVKNNSSQVTKETDYNVDLNDLNASKSLVSTYIAVLKSNTVMEEIGRRLLDSFDEHDLAILFTINDGKIKTSEISSCFSFSAVDETEVMKIKATTENPVLSEEMCALMADIAPEFLVRVVGAGSVQIIDTAVTNQEPVSPNIPLITLIGLIVGFSLAIFIILLVDFFDDTIKESEQVSKKFNKAILGEVDSISGDRSRGKKKAHSNGGRYLLTEKSIPFNVTESYKSIRTNIMFSLGTSDKKVIAVSSPNPSEGKSTTAANIAIAFAQTESTVLLIDADLRKPVQHKTFKVRNDEGLSTLIIGKSSLAKSVRSNVINGLDLLPSGPMPPNPSELLASEQFRALLDKLSKDYDYVIIDTPPVNVVSDAMVMKDSINGILLVLKFGETTYADVTNCMKQIELANASLFGFIINEIKHTHGSSYYNYKYKYKYKDYGYGYGYGYGHRPQNESEGADAD